MGQNNPTPPVVRGTAAIGVAVAGIGYAVRYDKKWSWLTWPSPDGIVVARASDGPCRPQALAARPRLPLDLAGADGDAVDDVLTLVTPGWWGIEAPTTVPARVVVHPVRDHAVVVPVGKPVLVDALDDDGPGLAADVVEYYTEQIRAGARPEILALDASRPGTHHELAFVLDGHHALAAYQALRREPTVRMLACRPHSSTLCWHPDGIRSQSDDVGAAGARRDCACAEREEDWWDCRCDYPLVFGVAEFRAALRDQPRTARQARPLFASVADNEKTWPGQLVDVPDGVGLIRVEGSRYQPRANRLWLGRQPAFADAYVNRGTLWHLVARLAPAERPDGIAALTDWLADPVIDRDHSGNPFVSRDLLDRLAPLLRLLAPGQYEVQVGESERGRLDFGVFLSEHEGGWPWPSGTWDIQHVAGPGVTPTDTWPPPDTDRVAWYRERIAAGAQPLMVLLMPGPATAEGRYIQTDMGYLLDGHHKAAAEARWFIRITPCSDHEFTEETFLAAIRPHLNSDIEPHLEFRGVGSLSSDWRYRTTHPGTSPINAAEYYTRYGVEYGNPAADRPHHITADALVRELAGRLDRRTRKELLRIVEQPAEFESRLLKALAGLTLTDAEFAMLLDLVHDLDNPRLAALARRSSIEGFPPRGT
ncbi:hypothetical protein AB4305_22640 [Nocardia sp. 2YAB30]|uniref:hypothetical protein n=1 Tax=unclassified Nocardia TaxID=2637762 RepID=UPI003F981798